MPSRQTPLSKLRRQLSIIGAKANLGLGRDETAIQQLQRLLEASPEDLELYIFLMTIYRDQCRWDDLLDTYKLADRLIPNNLNIKRELGTWLLFLARYVDAVPYLQFCLQHWDFPATYSQALGNLYARLGICYAYLGQWDEARAHLERAAEGAPKDLDLVFGMLLLKLGMGKVDEIDPFLDSRLLDDPGRYVFHYWRAYYLQHFQRRPEESLKWYEQALQIDYIGQYHKYIGHYFCLTADTPPSTILKGYVEVLISSGLKDVDAVISRVKRYRLPRDLDPIIIPIHTSILLGEFKKAEKMCRERLAKNLSPGLASELTNYLARAQMMQERYDEAHKIAEAALKLDSADLEAWETIGAIEMKMGDWLKARETFSVLTVKRPFYPSGWKNLGTSHTKCDAWEDAEKAYERALTLDGRDPESWMGLGETYQQLGQIGLARSAYGSALALGNLSETQRNSALALLRNL